MNINPMFNQKPKKQPPPPKVSKVRKVRSDKKHDIKIPISAYNKKLVLLFARRKDLSVTQYCTELVAEALGYNFDFEEVEYKHTDTTVHIKPDKELYNLIINKSVDWSCSIRRASHRVLHHALQMEGIANENLQQTKSVAKIY
ncbi:hypothetical protein RJD24_18470 [Bacillaceae bacterium IKA-2]|nr:hypothetical protein RJD24_18470 [Bacillaceae bacterium IKA-2]